MIPETIRSGGRAISSQMASLTLSAGLPSTIQPRVEPSSSSTCLTTSGVSSVIECADAALLQGRGDHRHLAQPLQLLAQGPQAGGEHAVVVGQKDSHGVGGPLKAAGEGFGSHDR